jgi:hypothetical protein
MLRNILNKLLNAGGLWFATVMIHLMTAFITSLAYLIIAVVIRWFNKST